MPASRFGLFSSDEVRALLTPSAGAPAGWIETVSDGELANELGRLCRVERLANRCIADPSFLAVAERDLSACCARYGLEIAADELRPFLDLRAPRGELFRRYLEFAERRGRRNDLFAAARAVRDPRMQRWHARQVERTTMQLSPDAADYVLHAPICFELSRGCSVGCWFCGVSAPKLTASWPWSAENEALWRSTLEVVGDLVGDGARAGFLYWATDPLDNPDYERFLAAYHDVLGVCPQTTTALPLADAGRTRALLRVSGARGCGLNRFSILSLGLLDRLEREFSPEELAFVELTLQNRQSRQPKSSSGRARERGLDRETMVEGTSACVTGFLINMVDRTIRLISPCNADDRWPLGYLVFDEGRFEDAAELRALLETMVARRMPIAPPDGERLRFRRDLEFSALADGFRVETRFHRRSFTSEPFVRDIGELVRAGDRTATEIAGLLDLCGVPGSATRGLLTTLFDGGLLDDEPVRRALPIAP